MTKVIKARFEFKGEVAAVWAEKNPILRQDEPGRERDTGKIKFGDGITRWNDLPYFADGSGGISDEELLNHINSLTPHPVYDDGPSFTLLYENAKV